MNRSYLFFILFILLMGIGGNWVINKASSSYDLPVIKAVPEFSFVNQDGEIFDQKDLKNKITVLDFFFTSCPGPCPVMAYNMKELYHDFSKIEELQFISITVDPKIDTQLELKQYADNQGVYDKRWQFLTSELQNIKNLSKKLQQLKKKGKKIILCHGVFDILHIGHIKHFETAKKKVDKLVVQ